MLTCVWLTWLKIILPWSWLMEDTFRTQTACPCLLRSTRPLTCSHVCPRLSGGAEVVTPGPGRPGRVQYWRGDVTTVHWSRTCPTLGGNTAHSLKHTHRKERWHHSSAPSNHWLCCSSARCLEEPTLTFMFHVWLMISWRQNVWKTKSSRLVSSEDAAEHRHSKCLLVKISQNIIKWRFLKLQTSVSKLWYVSINWFYYQSD